MSIKKIKKKKKIVLKNIKSLVPKNLRLNNLKVNPSNLFEGTKKKIGNFISTSRKKEKKRKKD